MENMVVAIIAGLFSSVLTVFVSKKINKAKFEVFIEQAKAKAKLIEHEAEVALKDAQLKAKVECDREFKSARKEYENMLFKIEKKDKELNEHLESELRLIKNEKREIEDKNRILNSLKEGVEEQKRDYKQKTLEAIKILENACGLTVQEAKDLMLEKVKEDSRATIASIFRKKYKLAEQNSKQEVNNILSQAVTRYAGEFAAERLINNIPLNDEETKGKIIGKEGRNIKALEMLLGVDIIIDDTPNTITVSSFNLYRRAIATKTIQELLEDGRIQPARIEEIYKKVKAEFDKNIQKEGEDVVMELGIKSMHPELIKLVGRLRYRASYGQNALAHTLEVAHLAGLIAAQMGGDAILARRALRISRFIRSITLFVRIFSQCCVGNSIYVNVSSIDSSTFFAASFNLMPFSSSTTSFAFFLADSLLSCAWIAFSIRVTSRILFLGVTDITFR